LKPGPINLGECTKDNWLEKVFPVVQNRIERYSRSEIRFNLMAIIKNRKTLYQEQIVANEKLKEQLKQTNHPDLAAKLASIEEENKSLLEKISAEEEKFKRWEVENVRRNHNYIPFLVNLLKILADKGKLGPLIQQATEKTSQKNIKFE